MMTGKQKDFPTMVFNTEDMHFISGCK